MKRLSQLLAGLCLASVSAWAPALDIQPYSAATLAELQAANRPVALHFHADWCPTCRAQTKVFNGWQGDASVPGTLLVVNYDKEKALRQKMGVRTQSTVIVFKGSAETGRLAGDTSPQALRAVLDTGR
jgi:thioredoxin 1